MATHTSAYFVSSYIPRDQASSLKKDKSRRSLFIAWVNVADFRESFYWEFQPNLPQLQRHQGIFHEKIYNITQTQTQLSAPFPVIFDTRDSQSHILSDRCRVYNSVKKFPPGTLSPRSRRSLVTKQKHSRFLSNDVFYWLAANSVLSRSHSV
jgi:hypothetical protein